MRAQLSTKAVLPLAQNRVTVSDRCSDTGPWALSQYGNLVLPV